MYKYINLLSILALSAASPCLASNTDYDQEFNRAIALSLNEQEQLPTHDEDIELAKALSLSLQVQEEKVEEKQDLFDIDHAIALSLQGEDAEKQRREENDFVFALQLELEPALFSNLTFHEINYIQSKQEEKRKLISAALLHNLIEAKKSYNILIEQTQKSDKLLDVHEFNKIFVIPHKQNILAINNILGLKQDLKPQQVTNSICSWKLNQGFPHFEKAVSTLGTHLNKTPIDAETGLNVPIMLSTCFSLCEQLQDHTFHLTENSPAMNAQQYYVYIINENIAEDGGCYPGFAGRLFAANIRFLCSLLGIE